MRWGQKVNTKRFYETFFFLRTIVGQATYVMFPLSKKEVKPVITHESKQPTGIQPGSQTPEVVLIRIFKIHKFSSVSDKKKNTLSPF